MIDAEVIMLFCAIMLMFLFGIKIGYDLGKDRVTTRFIEELKQELEKQHKEEGWRN